VVHVTFCGATQHMEFYWNVQAEELWRTLSPYLDFHSLHPQASIIHQIVAGQESTLLYHIRTWSDMVIFF